MAYRVIVTPRAILDAESAAEYIKRSSSRTAARWFRGLRDAVLSLSEMPQRCPIVPEAELLGVDIREHLYGKRNRSYRIIFRIYEGARPGEGVVRVLGIRHYARDRINIDEVQ